MALEIEVKSQAELQAEVDSLRAAVKALPENQRKSSPEFAAFVAAEKSLTVGMYGLYGLTFADGYVKVDDVTFDSKEDTTIHVVVYPSKNVRQAGEDPIRRLTFRTDIPDSMDTNPIAWAYEYVKGLTMFAGAKDV